MRPILAIAMLTLALAGCGTGGNLGTDALWGSMTGNSGPTLDPQDQKLVADAKQKALEFGQAGQATSWTNPANQHNGQIVPGAPYKQGTSFCRPFTHTMYINGQPKTTNGTACRQADGRWNEVG
ncbi:MAG: RT0821/Lpp0805 family surface protein [Pseudomonadota bacterium]